MTEGTARMVVGRYRLGRALGRGGMGAVWQARDTLLDRDVAVKEIFLPGAGPVGPADPSVRRALREAQAAARLRHPGIVTVHDVIVDEGRPWIVMELVGGRSLAEAIREHGPLPERQAAETGLRVLDALRTAHREGVLHRDVKPANILLDTDRVVLTDFGIAAIDDATALTATGQMVGSPAYLAPERINGKPATAAADLWALGITLYTAVAGRSPFQRADTQATMAAILTSQPAPPAQAGRLWPVIEGLLAKDPARRLTAEQARQLLAGVAQVPDAPRDETEGRRWVWPLAFAGLIPLLLIVAAGTVFVREWGDRPAAPTPTAAHIPTYAYARTLLPGRPICAAVWNPAGTRYAVTSADTGLEIFDQGGTLVRRFPVALAGNGKCYLNDPGVYWDPSGVTVAVVGGAAIGFDRLYFFNADTGATAVARLPVGQVFDTPMWDSTASAAVVRTSSFGVRLVGVEVWDPVARRRVATLLGPSGVMTDLRWSSNGRYLLAASHGEQRVHVYQASDWALLGALKPHAKNVVGIANGGVGNDGSVLLVPQDPLGIDVYRLS